MDDKLKRDIILDHYQNPFHKGLPKDEKYIKINGRSNSCIDNITIAILLDNDIIKDAYFDGEACAICTSATSVMLKKLIGKTKEEAEDIINNFYNMIDEKEYDESKLDELNVYDTIYKQPNRKNCALLPFKTMRNAINNERE